MSRSVLTAGASARRAALLLLLPGVVLAQTPAARAADVASPEAIVHALYEAVSRKPGEAFQWDRLRSLFLPGAQLIPNVEQTGGQLTVHTVESFIRWIDESWKPVMGTPKDVGFFESGVHAIIERFGDVAHVFSTYEKGIPGDPKVLGRGINSIQLLQKEGRWFVTAIAWDEETGAGPVPARYRGVKR